MKEPRSAHSNGSHQSQPFEVCVGDLVRLVQVGRWIEAELAELAVADPSLDNCVRMIHRATHPHLRRIEECLRECRVDVGSDDGARSLGLQQVLAGRERSAELPVLDGLHEVACLMLAMCERTTRRSELLGFDSISFLLQMWTNAWADLVVKLRSRSWVIWLDLNIQDLRDLEREASMRRPSSIARSAVNRKN